MRVPCISVLHILAYPVRSASFCYVELSDARPLLRLLARFGVRNEVCMRQFNSLRAASATILDPGKAAFHLPPTLALRVVALLRVFVPSLSQLPKGLTAR